MKPLAADRVFHPIVIIGGSNAGLSAALVLGRARRKVLIIDDENPRNKTVRKSYGFYTRDGASPAELLSIGRAQLRPYDVTFRTGYVEKAQKIDSGFLLILADGTKLYAHKIILATGVQDQVPDIPGLPELWGKSVFSCPYCDGWELQDQPLAVIGDGESALHYALMIHEWSRDVILCTDGGRELTAEQRADLQRHGIMVIDEKIARLESVDEVLKALHFEGGQMVKRTAIFMQPPCALRTDLARQLGCNIEKHGTQIAVDETARTCVEGVYAAGDAATRLAQIVIAAASGVTAAMTLNHDLVVEKLNAKS